MNTPSGPCPCPKFEHEIADLVDGLLDEAASQPLRTHLAGCAACRSFHGQYVAMNERLAVALPMAGPSPAFDALLQARVRALQAANGRDARRAAAEADHDALLDSLRRQTRRSALLGSLGAMACAVVAVACLQWLFHHAPPMHAVLPGPEGYALLVGSGAAIAIAMIGWTLNRSAIVTPRFLRW